MTDKPLRIIHVISAGRFTYGAVQSMINLAKAQIAEGHHVSFVTWKGLIFGQQMREMGYEVWEVRVRAKVDLVAIWQMAQHFKEQKADIVHGHLSTSSVNGCLAARLAKVKSVATSHGLSGKLSFIFADIMIGVSQAVCDHLIGQGVKPEKTAKVYNGVLPPPPLISKQEARDRHNLPQDKFIFGTVSRLTKLKGIDYSLEAYKTLAEQVPNSIYVLSGDGADMAEYQQWVKDNNLSDRIMFLGYQDDVWSVLPAFDVFIFPTLKDAMPMAIIEAMLAGLPIVASNVGGVPEVLGDNTGYLVPKEDAKAIAVAALDASKNEQIGQSARVRALTLFTNTSMAAEAEKVYRKLISR